MKRVKIVNGKVITPYRIIDSGTVAFEDEKIIYVGQSDLELEDCIVIDAQGNYVSPGFVDIHSHGGGGYDFMDGTCEAYLGAALKHVQHGTTSMVPTTVACTNKELEKTFEMFREAKRLNKNGSQFLGIHLEGPYFAMSQRGAQDSRYIRNPQRVEYEKILGLSDDIIRWSAAPELEGAIEFGNYLRGRGVLPSIGHSDAIYEQVQEAYENGFTHVTHLYSGMSGVHRINAYRYAGVIESAFLIEDMTVEIIADGAHLPPSLLQFIYKIKGPSRIALITDSMRAAGMPEGESIMGSINNGQKVIVENGVAKLMDRSAFAGSVATTDRLVRTVVKLAGIPLEDAIRMMTITPAKIIGADGKKGSLVKGKDADILIFDNEINIKITIVMGNIVYKSSM
jgi:N-acetylglucosamine-6-phosphate deacetylase